MRMRGVSMRWWDTAGSMTKYSVPDLEKRTRRNIAEASDCEASFALGGLAWVQRSLAPLAGSTLLLQIAHARHEERAPQDAGVSTQDFTPGCSSAEQHQHPPAAILPSLRGNTPFPPLQFSRAAPQHSFPPPLHAQGTMSVLCAKESLRWVGKGKIGGRNGTGKKMGVGRVEEMRDGRGGGD